jgi:valyl-tRNA synthetase
MSKSLGNSPDPLELIEKYGADGVRVGMLLCSPAGNDLMFDEAYCEQGRNFSNKLWNALRLVKGWNADPLLECPNEKAIEWFGHRFNEALEEITSHFESYRLSEALMSCYKLVWDDFCAWFLEMIKPAYQQPIDNRSLEAATGYFSAILRLLHPYMPFLTEELWHDELFGERSVAEACIVAPYPKPEQFDPEILKSMQIIQQVISEMRNLRNQKQISPKQALPLNCKISSGIDYHQYVPVLAQLANLSSIQFTEEKTPDASSFIAGIDEFFVPLESAADPEAERERISKELEYLRGFLRSVDAKLANERFVTNAKPEIVQNERNKKSDAEIKIRMLEESLAAI